MMKQTEKIKKAYYEANTETISPRQKVYYEGNRETILPRQKAYN